MLCNERIALNRALKLSTALAVAWLHESPLWDRIGLAKMDDAGIGIPCKRVW